MVLIFVPLTVTFSQNAKVIVKGIVKDTMNLTTYRYIQDKSKAYSEYVQDAPTKKEHTFVLPESICKERLYFSCNKNYTLLEVKPGQTVIIDVDGEKMNFSGDNAEINNFLFSWVHEYIASFPNTLHSILNIRNYYNRWCFPLPDGSEFDTEDAKNKLASINDKATNQLEQANIKDNDFVERQKAWNKYIGLKIFVENYKFLSKKGIMLSKTYSDLSQNWNFNDADLLLFPEGIDLLDSFFTFQETQLGVKRVEPNKMALRAQSIVSVDLREYYVLDQLKKLTVSSTAFLIDQIYNSVVPYITSEQGKNEYNAMQRRVDELAKTNRTGEDAYDFNYENEKGERIKLSNFKGKYVFIDLWATWCGPCIVEIPYLKKIEKELHDKNIAFVTISFDKESDKQKWKNFLVSNHMDGTQLIVDNGMDNELKKHYEINGIPRFILVDGQGKLVSANCIRPSEPALLTYLKEIIK